MFTYTELKNEIAKLAQVQGRGSGQLDKIGVYLNLAQDFLYGVYDYFTELQATYDFSSVDGREDYPMPNDFDKPLRIKDLTTPKDITITTEEEYVDANLSAVADSDEGTPDKARIYGMSGITGVFPSTGAVVFLKSSSASDTDVVVRVEGWVTGDKTTLGFESITLNGTTEVYGQITFYGITKVSKSKQSDGYITLYTNINVAGGGSVTSDKAYIPPLDRVFFQKVLKLGLIPDDAYDYRVWYKRKIRKMVNDYDYPFIDADNYFILDAWGWTLAQQKETAGRAKEVWDKAKEALEVILRNQGAKFGPDYQHKIINAFTKAHRA